MIDKRTFLASAPALAPGGGFRGAGVEAVVSARIPLGPDQHHRKRSPRYDIEWWRK